MLPGQHDTAVDRRDDHVDRRALGHEHLFDARAVIPEPSAATSTTKTVRLRAR